MKADLLISGARILTHDPALAQATSLAVWGGRIAGVDCGPVPARRHIDAGGATIVPGFNDAHTHSVWFGTTLLDLDLRGCASLEQVYERIARRAGELGPGEWVRAAGYNQMDTGGIYPDADALDRASGGRPVWIKHASGHACVLNRAALTLLGIRGDEKFHGGAVVVEDGTPTGVLEETAMALVQEHMLPLGEDDIVAALGAAHRVYAAEGITSVTDAGIGGGWIGHSPAELGAYQSAREAGALLARTQVMPALDALADLPLGQGTFRGLPTGARSGLGDEWLSLGPVKVFLDGSILANTARMSGGYDNCPGNHGYFQDSPAALREAAVGAGRSGWALAMHAVGDEAIDLAIDILTRLRGHPPPLPHRIEHGGVVTDAQLGELAELGVPIVSQPHFMRAFGDGFRDYIGEERTALSFRGASQLRAGLALAGSSDRPVAAGAPLEVMHSAVHRRTASGWVYGPAERLTWAEALAAYTEGSAQVTGWAHAKGRLAEGYLADFVVLDGDPTHGGAGRVLSTVVGGRPVFDDAGPFAGEVGS